MSAALKSDVLQPTPTRSRRRKRSVTNRSLSSIQGAVARIPDQETSPLQGTQPALLTPPATGPLKLLSKLQLVSSVLAGSLAGLALVTYGASVYVDRQLDQATSRLTRLQRSEQQLTTTNEVLKNHLARQAEASAGELIPPTPDHVIFLRPAQQRTLPSNTFQGQPAVAFPGTDRPMGY